MDDFVCLQCHNDDGFVVEVPDAKFELVVSDEELEWSFLHAVRDIESEVIVQCSHCDHEFTCTAEELGLEEC